MRAMAAVVLLLVPAGGRAAVDEPLVVDRTIEREIASGASHAYTITLDADEYLAGSADAHGIAVLLSVLGPDGSRLRAFEGTRDDHTPFAFLAEATGTYRLELTAAATGRYALTVTQRLTLEQRLSAATWEKYLSAHGSTSGRLNRRPLHRPKGRSDGRIRPSGDPRAPPPAAFRRVPGGRTL
jgi:hypothetical protein